ncbi:unnamed protein product [Meloidogyne enterolobii]|uniref:Uncharacterized protein n=1 Tax=Meloidogyne enterolobii TaxID=390850 RepID=A0ACB0Z504_MELEN
MIVLIIIGCFVWLLVCRKKEEEEEQPLEDYFGTPGITGTGGTAKTTTEVTEERPTIGDTQNKTGYFDKASEDYDNTFKRDGT